MTATVKDFCQINDIAENSDNLVDIIYNALTGGDCDGRFDEDCGERPQNKTSVSNCHAGKTDS